MIERLFNRASFAARLSAEIATRRLTQVEAARQMGISDVVLSRVLNCVYEPKVESYLRITRWLDSAPQVPIREYMGSRTACIAALAVGESLTFDLDKINGVRTAASVVRTKFGHHLSCQRNGEQVVVRRLP